VDKIIYIGKEADKIEESLSGLTKVNYSLYRNPTNLKKIFSLTWKDVKNCGISKSQFYEIRKQLESGTYPKLNSKTLKRLEYLGE